MQRVPGRCSSLGPDTAGRLAGRAPLTALPMAVPVSPDVFRAPLGVGLGGWTSRVYGFYFVLIAASDLYRSPLNSGIDLARLTLALILAANLWAFIGFSLPVMLWASLRFVGTLTAWLPDEAAPLPRQPASSPALAGQLPLVLILVKVICAALGFAAL